MLYRSADPRRSTLVWKFYNGGIMGLADFGDPVSRTQYGVCVYDSNGGSPNLAMRATVPPAGRCGTVACWQSLARNQGYRYIDRSLVADGVYVLWLRPNGVINLQAYGVNLPVPSPATADRLLLQDRSVTVQIVNSDGKCWEAAYTSPAYVNKKYVYRNGAEAYLFRDSY